MKKPLYFLGIITSLAVISCNSNEEKSEKGAEAKDSVKTDETETPAVEDVEMEYHYEVTYTKTKKVVMMSQEEYLESGIWENPDVVIKEIPVAK